MESFFFRPQVTQCLSGINRGYGNQQGSNAAITARTWHLGRAQWHQKAGHKRARRLRHEMQVMSTMPMAGDGRTVSNATERGGNCWPAARSPTFVIIVLCYTESCGFHQLHDTKIYRSRAVQKERASVAVGLNAGRSCGRLFVQLLLFRGEVSVSVCGKWPLLMSRECVGFPLISLRR